MSCRDRCSGASPMRRRRIQDVAGAGAAGGSSNMSTAVVRWPPRAHQDILHVSIVLILRLTHMESGYQ